MSGAITMTCKAALFSLACVACVAGGAPAAAQAQGMMDNGMMGRGGMMGGGMMNGASARHAYTMRHGLPEAYAKLANPLPASPENIAAGRRLYEQACAACHGATGYGDGPAGGALNPRPADLARLVRMPIAGDGYLYWAIAEGGAPFSTAMPAMKDTWKPGDIWKVILYLRTL